MPVFQLFFLKNPWEWGIGCILEVEHPQIGISRFPQLKILLGKKERSVDFADEAVVDFYFLLTTSVLALDSFVDGYFFN